MKKHFGAIAGGCMIAYAASLICHIVMGHIFNRQYDITGAFISSTIPVLCILLLIWNKSNKNKQIKTYMRFSFIYIITLILMLIKFHLTDIEIDNKIICISLLLATIPILTTLLVARFLNTKQGHRPP